MGEEAVPEELAPHRVERPVGRLRVDEDDARVLVARVVVAPHVEVAVRALRVGARRLEPRVLVARVVHDEVDDDAHPARVRLADELGEVRRRAVLRRDRGVVGHVVAAVAQWRRVEGRQPQRVDAEPLEVVEAVDQPAQVARPAAVGVGERADDHLVEHRRAVPVRVVGQTGARLDGRRRLAARREGRDGDGRGERGHGSGTGGGSPHGDRGRVPGERHEALTWMTCATWRSGSSRTYTSCPQP